MEVSRKGNPKARLDRTAPQPSPTDCASRSLLTGRLTHDSAVRLRGLLSVVRAMLSVRLSRSPFGRPRTGRSDVCGRPVSRPHGLRDLRSRSAHPPTEQVLSSPHSVTSFPCEDTVRASSDKPFARLTHGSAVRLRGFPAHGSCLPVRSDGGHPRYVHEDLARCLFVASHPFDHTHKRAPRRWPGAARREQSETRPTGASRTANGERSDP